MIKGFRFTNQLANAEVDARIHQEFLNKNDGIFYGMGLSYTNNSITISEGLCEIAGRPIAVIDSETVNVGTENLYCLLILEIDLSKDSTKDVFNQASFKLLTSSTSYPTVTQQDINKYSGTESLYQLEFARFRSGSNGISEFKDTRLFLNFDGIYSQIKSECQSIINQIKQELANVEDGSSYLLKNNIAVIEGSVNLVASPDNSPKQTTWQLDFPEGFNSRNCVCIAFGTRLYSDNIAGYAYGTGFEDSIGTFSGDIPKSIELGFTNNISKIWCQAYNILSEQREMYFKIVLLKIEAIEEEYTLGDINGDGNIDNDDVQAIQDYIMSQRAFTNTEFKAADVNKDGEVKATDYIRLKNYVEGRIDSLN